MKALYPILLVAAVIGANALLPPGYEDDMWCPPDNCRFYTNPFGFVGAASSFNKCKDLASGEVTDGVWTGSLTNVTVPDGWIEPQECTAEEYSECTTNDDCTAVVRTQAPSSGGWASCSCFADSALQPFDQCEGANETECETLNCTGNECQYYVAECITAWNGTTGNTCEISMLPGTYTWDENGNEIRSTDPPSSSPIENPENVTNDTVTVGSALAMEIPCTNDDECFTLIRSRAPGGGNEIGVGICGCYANSVNFPFDECEGRNDTDCIMARCMGDACDGLEAYCMLNEDEWGSCNVRKTGNASFTGPSITTTPGPVNYTWSGGRCSTNDDCYPKTRERVPGLSETIGVTTCECYANSYVDPLDECQGESDMTCPIAGCMENPCEGATAYCSEVEGICVLDTPIDGVTNDIVTEGLALAMEIPCSNDDECFTVIRSRAPGGVDVTGVGVCECYANSVNFPFDECEGRNDTGCIIAKCMGDACDGLEAYCMLNEDERGSCNVRQTGNASLTGPSITTTPVPVNYTWSGGRCSTNDDCYPKTRERVPGLSKTVGVTTCECYANSYVDPLDECQGESDMTCPIAGCMENQCEGASAYCSEVEGICVLDTPIDGNVTNDIVTEGLALAMEIPCTIDDECFTLIRSRAPGGGDMTGVGVCECYANSVNFPFDECEGRNDMGCIIAKCMGDACDGLEAYCRLNEDERGFCNVRETDNVTLAGPSVALSPPVPGNYTWSGGRCSTNDDCYPKVRERVPGLSETIGVTTCECYANSYMDPLDECQGESDMTCPIAGCMENQCEGAIAYCSEEEGICLLSTSAQSPEGNTTDSTTSTITPPDKLSENETTSNETSTVVTTTTPPSTNANSSSTVTSVSDATVGNGTSNKTENNTSSAFPDKSTEGVSFATGSGAFTKKSFITSLIVGWAIINCIML